MLRRKDLNSLLQDKAGDDKQLKRTLNALDITLLGIGTIIGSGLFVVTGVASAKYAGPAVVIAFIAVGIVCIISALAYAELASIIPAAGGAYAFSYVILGEMAAWIAAWNFIFGCSLSIGVIADGWSSYMAALLGHIGINIPEILLLTPLEGGIIDLLAMSITLLVSVILVRGTRGSANLNTVLTSIKLFIILTFIILIAPHVKTANLHPFMPYRVLWIMPASSLLFFAYSGFETLATTAEECRNPSTDLPIGIIGSMLICTAIYVIFSIALVGACNYKLLDIPEPVAFALEHVGYSFGSEIITIGVICGLTSGLIFQLFAVSRVFFSLSRDNLISRKLYVLHPRYKTPYQITFAVAIISSLAAGFVPMRLIAECSNICLIFVTLTVLTAVIVYRKTDPGIHRPFRFPMVYIFAPVGINCCLLLMIYIDLQILIIYIVGTIGIVLVYLLFVKKRNIFPVNENARTHSPEQDN